MFLLQYKDTFVHMSIILQGMNVELYLQNHHIVNDKYEDMSKATKNIMYMGGGA